MKTLFVILASLMLVGAFAASAAAADWAFYGSSRFQTWYEAYDFGDGEDPDNDGDVRWDQYGASRIGAHVTGGPIKGRFEYGTSGGNANIRLLWGEYDFGNMQLRLGQDYTPVHTWTSGQVFGEEANLLATGGLYGSRKDQIQLRFSGVEIAFIEVNTPNKDLNGDGIADAADVDKTLPKIEARYDMKVGLGRIGIMGGFNRYKIESDDQDDDVTINSWVIGAIGAFSFGSAYVNANLFAAGNYTDYGLPSWYNDGTPGAAVVDDWDTEDASSMGGILVVGFAASDTMNVEGGLGYVSHKNDDYLDGDADTTVAFYVNTTITVGQGFTITPEIGHYAFGDDASGDNDVGSLTYAGAKWQMNF